MSTVVASGLWSAQQCAWLQALGHTLYVPGGVEPEPATEVDTIPPVVQPAAGQRSVGSGHPAPAAPSHREPAAVPVAAPEMRAPAAAFARRPPTRMPDRLQIALLRASGLNPNDTEAQRLMAAWPLAGLRGNPAAKRAFWPQLRALRRP